MIKFCTLSIVCSILFAFLLTSCSYRRYSITTQLTNIPLIPHNKDVELYFGNELPNNKVYYEVLGLAAEGGSDYNALLLQLKSKAKNAGVDAVIHINNSQASYTSSEGRQYNAQIVKGVGIKYRENLTYINGYIKSKKVYNLSEIDSNTLAPLLIYEAPFHILGHEITSGHKPDVTYIQFVRELSFDYLLYETYHWTYNTDEYKRVNERRKNISFTQTPPYIRCLFTYKPGRELYSIKIVYPKKSHRNVYMELVYSSKDKVSEKQIYDNARKKKKLLYVEKLAYDQLNRIAQTTLYKVEQGQQIPFLQTVYDYYTMDDLPAPKNL